MNINFSIEEAVRKRFSVRNYSEQEVEESEKNEIEVFVESLDNPFEKKVNFHYLDSKDTKDEKVLGTYGVIKGANQYIGTTIKLEPLSLEALGYELETLMLYLTNIDIGTCYEKMTAADKRKEWDKLFYKDNFEVSLTGAEAGDLQFALEMTRLGPSASNKQPWRIVLKDKSCHFYEYKEPGYSDIFPDDIQRIDMGIAAAHFDHAVKEKNIKGEFRILDELEIKLPENMEYVFGSQGIAYYKLR